MTDIIDQAQDIAEVFLQAEIHNARLKSQLPGTQYCIDCGDEIPEARRMVRPNATRCRECQDWHELENKIAGIEGTE